MVTPIHSLYSTGKPAIWLTRFEPVRHKRIDWAKMCFRRRGNTRLIQVHLPRVDAEYDRGTGLTRHIREIIGTHTGDHWATRNSTKPHRGQHEVTRRRRRSTTTPTHRRYRQARLCFFADNLSPRSTGLSHSRNGGRGIPNSWKDSAQAAVRECGAHLDVRYTLDDELEDGRSSNVDSKEAGVPPIRAVP